MERSSEIPGNSNLELKGVLSERFKDMFWSVLSLLEIAFPHEKGDGSENEKKFNALRSKVLRIGNDSVRELDEVFENYATFKIFEYQRRQRANAETVIFDFRQHWSINNKTGKVGNENG